MSNSTGLIIMEKAITAAAQHPPPLPPKTKIRSSSSSSLFSPLNGSPSRSTTTVNVNSVGFNSNIPTKNHLERRDQTSSDSANNHVVKILINPDRQDQVKRVNIVSDVVSVKNYATSDVICDVAPCIRISVNSETDNQSSNMISHQNNSEIHADRGSSAHPYYFFNNCVMSSGQVSPSDTLDSGTCSDLDGTPPPLPKKKSGSGVSVTLIGTHKKTASCSSGAEVDSDDNDSSTSSSTSSISCDSLNCGKVSSITAKPPPTIVGNIGKKSSFLPPTLLQDIRQRNSISPENDKISCKIVEEKPYEQRKQEQIYDEQQENVEKPFDPDMFFDFHMNEKDNVASVVPQNAVIEDETFAGYKDLLGDGASTIRSSKGTVRGVKNRVRAGIATFLQINDNGKNYKEKEAGKVVVYTTTMGILRDTYQACMKVKQIMRTLLVKFDEKDVFMSSEYQAEIQERMKCDQILVPQVFVNGQHIGDAETIERLNESGELRRILKPFKSPYACNTCKSCGGYRLLPCHVCNGSKKSVHRNHFTAEFVALKCMSCDEVGLVRCNDCS